MILLYQRQASSIRKSANAKKLTLCHWGRKERKIKIRKIVRMAKK